MAVEIDIVRHGETEANLAGVWQGQTDSPLTARGRAQVAAAARRLAKRDYALVVSSDLGRAVALADAVGGAQETDASWRETSLGAWEGLTTPEIEAEYPDEIAALSSGEQIRFGGGEMYAEVAARGAAALAKVAARLDDGERALVVSHGGLIGSVVGQVLGLDALARREAMSRLANTAITTVALDGEAAALTVYNDAAHLDGASPRHRTPEDGTAGASLRRWAPGDGTTTVTLFRHGESEGNAAGRWQGHTDGRLTAVGRSEAALAAAAVGAVDAVYSSDLSRARDTAAAFAERHGVAHDVLPGLREMAFGEWEDHAPEAIAARWPEQWQRIYVDGEDLPRGTTGETYRAAADRLAASLAELAGRHPGQSVVAVGHGGAIRAYVTSFLGLTFPERRRLGAIRNTASCRLVLGGGRPRLADYNVAPHFG